MEYAWIFMPAYLSERVAPRNRSQFPKGYGLAGYKMRQILVGGGGVYRIDSFAIQATQLEQLEMQNKLVYNLSGCFSSSYRT